MVFSKCYILSCASSATKKLQCFYYRTKDAHPPWRCSDKSMDFSLSLLYTNFPSSEPAETYSWLNAAFGSLGVICWSICSFKWLSKGQSRSWFRSIKQLVPKPDRQYTRDHSIVLNQWAEKGERKVEKWFEWKIGYNNSIIPARINS